MLTFFSLQPILDRKHVAYNFFLDPYYLFKLPALTLIVGLLLIDGFISKTNANIARERAERAAKEKAKAASGKKNWEGSNYNNQKV